MNFFSEMMEILFRFAKITVSFVTDRLNVFINLKTLIKIASVTKFTATKSHWLVKDDVFEYFETQLLQTFKNKFSFILIQIVCYVFAVDCAILK